MQAKVVAAEAAPASPVNSPTTTCISRSSSQQNVDTDSGKSSSCSPGLLDCSYDSGIALEATDLQLHKRIQQCKRILTALERNKDSHRLLRERLSKIVDRKGKRPKEPDTQHFCNVCCEKINPDDLKCAVSCGTCKKHVCRNLKCAIWVPQSAQWECQLCQTSKDSLAHTSSWVAEQMSFNKHKYIYPMRARSEIFIPINECQDGSLHFESVSQIGAHTNPISIEQKIKIREYVEEIVAGLLGGSLDSITVSQMSKSENYLPALVNGRTENQIQSSHNGQDADFANISESRLRRLIQTIISETLKTTTSTNNNNNSSSNNNNTNNNDNKLSIDGVGDKVTHEVTLTKPINGDIKRRHRTEHYFEPKIYEDLLATAVLNKIVDKQKNARRFAESIPDLNLNAENASTTSGSSIEPHSDCSYTDNEQLLNVDNFIAIESTATIPTPTGGRESALSDYLATHMVPLPDLSFPATESEEDDYASVTSSAIGEGTWEDNWLFKKKRPSLTASVTGTTASMLVPAPKEDVRAQIGDKTADEVSDLSEMGSETDEPSVELMRTNNDPLNDRLLNKHLIGGANTKLVLDELIDTASTISATSLVETNQRITETKNENVNQAVATTEAVNINVGSTNNVVTTINQSEQTDNLTEATVPLSANLTSKELTTTSETTSDKKVTTTNSIQNQTLTNGNKIASGDDEDNDDGEIVQMRQFLPGSIAEREYKKWYNAVDMPNNPYAPEALRKRISGSQERFIDLPNISPSTEVNPIEIMKKSSSIDETDEQLKISEVKRYSRDYYINESKDITTTTPPGMTTTNNNMNNNSNNSNLKNFGTINISDEPTTDNIVINEETTIIREVKSTDTTTVMEGSDAKSIVQTTTTMEVSKPPTLRKQRPTDLELGGMSGSSSITSGLGSPFTPTRGSTPTAFKFLQPKRKLIEPSQVLSIDDESQDLLTQAGEKAVIENEVAQVMPSVKALAQAFLNTSSKSANPMEKRWLQKTRKSPEVPKKPSVKKKNIETLQNATETAEDATITSDLSSLDTDSTSQPKDSDSPSTTVPTTPPPTPAEDISSTPVRSGILKSNIAFFENLKFK